MSTTLGLDIGTNSIGWCLTEDKKRIIDIGVRIFPVGVKEDDYAKTGTEISKNATRRQARGIRRLYDRYKIRRKILIKLLRELDMYPTEEMILKITAPILYGLRKKALDEQISLKEIGRIFLLLNQRRGFKSSKKDAKTEEAKKERSETLKKMNELSQKVKDSGSRTVGEYFYNLFEDNKKIENWHNDNEPSERIRNRFVYRKLYDEEFDNIWDKQKEYYPEILNDDNKKKIKNNCIFYQRPLKSQKHLVGKCRFEPKKRVAPRSSFEFQEFRIWQTISNIRVTIEVRFRDLLTLEEKNKLANQLMISEKVGKNEIKKEILNLGTRTKFNEFPDKLNGNTTNAKLRKALGYNYYDNLNDNIKYKLWHTLFFANDEEWLMKYAVEKLGLSKEQSEKYVEIDLEPDYSSISVKAIRKILPLMKEGHDYAKSCELAGYHHSFDEETDSKERILNEKIIRTKGDEIKNPLVMQSLSETYRLVNAIIAEHGKPDKVRVELARQLKWPKWKREEYKRKTDQTRNRRDDYIEFLKEKGLLKNVTKSDILKFELWLEMQYCEKELKKINEDVDVAEFKKFAKNVKPTDNEKYKLYLECGRISPYTGKVISLKELFSSEIEVEHIIPYSKCMDDSFINKTLCERDFNHNVGNQIKAIWFNEHKDEKKDFIERIKYFNDVKQEKFLTELIPDDFLNSQLTNNAYIAREARKKLKTVCHNVYITNGQATSALRKFWNLNVILNPDGKNEKSRDDHRHHAIDALVIANTSGEHIRLLSTASNFDYKGRLTVEHFPEPFENFIEESEDKINEILVSYRNKRRLITTKKNKYIHSKKNQKAQNSISVRGSLHEDSIFGRILHPELKEIRYVVSKPLNWFTEKSQLNKIVDSRIKEILNKRIDSEKFKGKIKQALAYDVNDQIKMTPNNFNPDNDKNSYPIIKSVRVSEIISKPIEIKQYDNNKFAYVKSGDNFMIAVYGDTIPNGKGGKKSNRDFETIPYFDAVKQAIEKKNFFKHIKNDKNLLFTLQQKDLVVLFKEHPDEIDWNNKKEISNRLYRVMDFDIKGIIRLGIHKLSRISSVLDPSPIAIRTKYSTIKIIKVKLTTTGKIINLN